MYALITTIAIRAYIQVPTDEPRLVEEDLNDEVKRILSADGYNLDTLIINRQADEEIEGEMRAVYHIWTRI